MEIEVSLPRRERRMSKRRTGTLQISNCRIQGSSHCPSRNIREVRTRWWWWTRLHSTDLPKTRKCCSGEMRRTVRRILGNWNSANMEAIKEALCLKSPSQSSHWIGVGWPSGTTNSWCQSIVQGEALREITTSRSRWAPWKLLRWRNHCLISRATKIPCLAPKWSVIPLRLGCHPQNQLSNRKVCRSAIYQSPKPMSPRSDPTHKSTALRGRPLLPSRTQW